MGFLIGPPTVSHFVPSSLIKIYIVGGKNHISFKNPILAEACEIKDTLTKKTCHIIKDSSLDKIIRPKAGVVFSVRYGLKEICIEL